MFGVPYIVADNFLKVASEQNLKVLLYILRNGGRLINTAAICENLNYPAETVEECIMFWRQYNVLADSPTVSVPAATEAVTTQTAPVKEEKLKKQEITSYGRLSPSVIAKAVEGSKDLKVLLDEAQQLFGTVNYTVQNSLIWMHEYLGLKAAIILMLVQYCKSIGIEITNKLYMEKIAVEWSEKGVTTHELAQEEINRMFKARTYTGQIKKLLGLKYDPTAKQTEIVMTWEAEGYSFDLIKLAGDKAIESKGIPKITYINGILKNFKKDGTLTVEEVLEAEENRRNKQKSQADSDDDDDDDYDDDFYAQFENKF